MPCNEAFYYEDQNQQEENYRKLSENFRRFSGFCRRFSGFIPKDVLGEEEATSYDKAIELTGNGMYNYFLTLLLSVQLLSMALDMFGISIIVIGAACDFQLDMMHQSILTSIPFVGAIILSYPWGYITDSYGRKKSLLISSGLSFIFAVLSSFSPNWITLAVLRFLSSGCNIQSAAYTLLGESCWRKFSGIYMLIINSVHIMGGPIFIVLGYFVLRVDISYDLGFVGYFTPWRLYTIILALPMGISSLCLLSFYESPKFLHSIGKEEEALRILKEIYKSNSGEEDGYTVKKISLDESDYNGDMEGESLFRSLGERLKILFTPPLLLRTLKLFYLTFIVFSVSTSLSMWFPFIVDAYFEAMETNGRTKIGFCELVRIGSKNETHNEPQNTDVYLTNNPDCKGTVNLNTTLATAIIGVILTAVSLGVSAAASRKRVVMMIILSLSALGGILITFTPEAFSSLVMYMLFMGNVLASGFISNYFVELYPTTCRGTVSSLGMLVARVGALVGIFIIGSFIVSDCSVTFYGYSVFLIVAAVTAYFLPKD